MVQKIIILTASLALCASSLSGAETTEGTPVRPKVLIYNFKPGRDDRKNDYYSAIIPLTIIKSLGSQDSYDVRHVNEILALPDGSSFPGAGPSDTKNPEEGIQTYNFDVLTDDMDQLEKKYDERMKALLRKLKEILESSGEDSPGTSSADLSPLTTTGSTSASRYSTSGERTSLRSAKKAWKQALS